MEHRAGRHSDPALQEHRMEILGLRAGGLSYNAIAWCLRFYHAVTLTENQIRYAIKQWGEPPHTSKVRRPVSA